MLNIKENYTELIQIRRALHQYPEKSECELETSNRIIKHLYDCKPDEIITNVGGYGVMAVFDSKIEGPTVMLRADMDALPIQETNTFAHRSKHQGISHKCGHDGHTTILIGLAKKLHQTPPNKGKVVLLFQAAEENGVGAKAVLKDHKFSKISPDYVFALHNLPGFPMNSVVVKEGHFTASVISLIIKLYGKTAHAAEPEHGNNPSYTIASLINKISELSNNDPTIPDFACITPIQIEVGSEDYGISAGYGELKLTLRCWTEKRLEALIQKIEALSLDIGSKDGIDITLKRTQHFVANKNNLDAVKVVRKAAGECSLEVIEVDNPFKWGEDFGLFTDRIKGAMFGLGAGIKTPALHNPDYDFPDELLESGVPLFHKIIKSLTA